MINPVAIFETTRSAEKKTAAASKKDASDSFSFGSVLGKTEKAATAREKQQPGATEMTQTAGETLQNSVLHRQDQIQDDAETDQSSKGAADLSASQKDLAQTTEKNGPIVAVRQALPAITTAASTVLLSQVQPEAGTFAQTLETAASHYGSTALPAEIGIIQGELTVMPASATASDVQPLSPAAENQPALTLQTEEAAALASQEVSDLTAALPGTAELAEAVTATVTRKTDDRGRHLGQIAKAVDGEAMDTPVSAGRRTDFPWKLANTADQTNTGQHNGESKSEKLPLQGLEVQPATDVTLENQQGTVDVQTFSQVQEAGKSSKTVAASPASQVADQVAEAVKNQRFELKMKLQPEGLGQLTVKMAFEGGKLTLHIMADTPQAQNILAQQMGELKTALQVQNVVIDRMNVSLENHQQSQWSNGNFRNYQGQGQGNENRFLRQHLPTAIAAIVETNSPAYQLDNSRSILNYRI